MASTFEFARNFPIAKTVKKLASGGQIIQTGEESAAKIATIID